MLAAHEFSVGNLADAEPLSLMLPRSESEYPLLVGHIDGQLAAAVLSERYAFECIEAVHASNWSGIIIQNVRIEVDESSVFMADHLAGKPGSVIRTDTQLLLRVKRERSTVSWQNITLHDNIPVTAKLRAGFLRWQVVVGESHEKRVLWTKSE